ncbi:MAG: succinylglutamate desuccinylase/aspartoacylase family protein [bacterium]|nr:succinylglutamate desuccinylase/aspartoacylase family protein [bacterium]
MIPIDQAPIPTTPRSTTPDPERLATSSLTDIKRVIGRVGGPSADHESPPGPTVIIVAGQHGNEPSGVHAAVRVLQSLRTAVEREPGCFRGEFIALAGNVEALRTGVRFIETDLNRLWTPGAIDETFARTERGEPVSAEQREQRELADEITDAVLRSRGPTFLLDLHTTSASSRPFLAVEDIVRVRELARAIPVTGVLGLEAMIRGILPDWFNTVGDAGLIFEAGQHDDPASIERHEAAIWLLLAEVGVIGHSAFAARLEAARSTLEPFSRGLPRLLEARARHSVSPEDGFRMRKGFENFHPVVRGDLLAGDSAGTIRAPMSGWLFMPLYQPQGEDGFFIARRASRIFMRLSKVLRPLKLHKLVHLLPGVSRSDADVDAFVVNPKVARVLAHEVFAMLGYRRYREHAGVGVFGKTAEDMHRAWYALPEELRNPRRDQSRSS